MIKPLLLAVSVLLSSAPTFAQTADPHAGHAMPGATPALPAAAPMDHSMMPGMDHSNMDMATPPAASGSAMPGMNHGDHGKMNMKPGAVPPASGAPMAGMDHGSMGGMVMADGTIMNMAPTPKGITRRNLGPAEAALQGFLDAVEVGNRDLAIGRLAPSLVVVENGAEDDLAGYVGGHLASDMAFAKTVKTILLSRQVMPDSPDRTRIVSTSRMMSNRSDRPVDITLTETATVTKIGSYWKVSRLEWNSAATTPAN